MFKNEIHIGIERPNNKSFDDTDKMNSLAQPITISMIKLQYNKDGILGIKIKYRGMDGDTIVGNSSRKFKLFGVQFSKFKIAKNDCIKEIFGFADNKINQLGFKTYKGEGIICGTNKGQAFSYQIPNNTFVAAKGSQSEFLEYLSFQVIQLTQDQILKIGIGDEIQKKQSLKQQ